MPKVRPAELRDLPAWAAMRAALWPDGSAAGHLAELEAWFLKPKFHGFVAEREDGRLVAFAELYEREFANGCDSQPVPFLEGIWVEEALRRQGVARALLAAAEAFCKENGFSELGSDALIENAQSIQAHAAWGFSEIERTVCFSKKL